MGNLASNLSAFYSIKEKQHLSAIYGKEYFIQFRLCEKNFIRAGIFFFITEHIIPIEHIYMHLLREIYVFHCPMKSATWADSRNWRKFDKNVSEQLVRCWGSLFCWKSNWYASHRCCHSNRQLETIFQICPRWSVPKGFSRPPWELTTRNKLCTWWQHNENGVGVSEG